MEIRNVMTKKVYSLFETNTILDAVILMRNKDIGFIPIVNLDNEVIGVLTDRDIVLSISNNYKIFDKLKDIMKRKVYSLDETDSIVSAQEVMSYNRIKRLVVTRNNKLIGILSISDIIQNNQVSTYSFDILKELTFDEKKAYKVPELDLRIDDFNL